MAILALSAAPFLLTTLLHTFLFHPSRDEDPYAARFGERVRYRAADGVELVSWWVPARGERRRTIVYFHGNAATASQGAYLAEVLRDSGSDVLLAEYRGYGASTGAPSTTGIERDGDAAMRWLLEERGIPPREIVVYGQSLGGAVAVHVLAGTGRDVAGGVLESTFTSLHDMSRAVLGLPLTYALPEGYALDSASRAGAVRAPILHLHGDRDEVVPFALGEALDRRLTTVERFVRVPGGAHNLDGAQTLDAIVEFARRVVP